MERPAQSCKAVFAAGIFLLAIIGIAGPAYSSTQPTFLYSIGGNSLGSGAVFGYVVDSTTGALSPVPGSPFGAGLFPISVVVSPSNKFVYVANYGSKNISAYAVDGTTGALTEVSGSPFAACGAAESIAIVPSGKFLYVGCDNSGHNLAAYTIDHATGALTPLPGSPYITAPIPYDGGYNAWAVAMDPSGKFLYVANDSGFIFSYQIDSNTGALTRVSSSDYSPGDQATMGVEPSGKFLFVTGRPVLQAFMTEETTGELTQVTSTLASGYAVTESLGIDPLDRFVYTVNGAPYNLSAFSIDLTTGALTPIAGSPFAWSARPFSMAIEPSGKFAYVAEYNVGSNGDIAAFTIDGTNGTLAPISGSPFAIGSELFGMAITNVPSSTPFEKFEAKVYIDEDRKTSFRAEGFFKLSEGNSGIDPVTQSVELQVGTYTVTIPSGSFEEKGKHDSDFDDHRDRDRHDFDHDRDRKEHEFEFKGEIDGVDLTIRIDRMKKNEYIFTAEGRGDILQGIKNPVTVGLTIGNYAGSTSVKADIDR